MHFKSEKQKAFFERISAGKAKKKGEGDLSTEVAQRVIDDSHEAPNVEKVPQESDFGKKMKFSKIMKKLKK